MIDICCESNTLYAINCRYDVMLHIMQDDMIKPDDFIELEFDDGCKAAIQKKRIIGFFEYCDEV